ncbi:transposase [Paenibacillus sp. sgz302251]|uniref:transposase n=1 Tax=Paenibacillus sp. sgz302251 TaxID=3414493 RepID=UPI003C7BFFDF
MIDILKQMEQLFSNEEQCIEFVYKIKWPTGFLCPVCTHTSAYVITTRRLPLYECNRCGRQTSLTAGTAMDKSKTPLQKWLLTLFIVATHEQSINAVGLSALIDVTYKTAWSMLNKLRRVISASDMSTLLSGMIKAKLEIYMKQPIPTYDALQQEHAAIVARTVTTHNETSYVKIKLAPAQKHPRAVLNKLAEHAFMEQHICSTFSQIEINKKYSNPPHCEAKLPRIAKNAFQWINNTFHGLGLAYAQSYLDEFCFRQNYSRNLTRCPFELLLELCLSHTNTHYHPQISAA